MNIAQGAMFIVVSYKGGVRCHHPTTMPLGIGQEWRGWRYRQRVTPVYSPLSELLGSSSHGAL